MPTLNANRVGEGEGFGSSTFSTARTANAFAVYSAGSDINNLAIEDQVAVIDNTGRATFSGALEAASIDGGVYSAE